MRLLISGGRSVDARAPRSVGRAVGQGGDHRDVNPQSPPRDIERDVEALFGLVGPDQLFDENLGFDPVA